MTFIPKDDFESEVQQWMDWQGTPPFVSSPAWKEAQRRQSVPQGLLGGLLKLLQSQAGPRGATFAGRVTQPGESLQSVMGRFPQGELEGGGLALDMLPGVGLAGMAKIFKPPQGMSNRGARLAKAGTQPQTPYEKMLAAVIDENTGEALYQMRPYRAGDHGGLMTVAESIPNWRPVRGFVDPATFDAFTEAMLEEALMKRKGILP